MAPPIIEKFFCPISARFFRRNRGRQFSQGRTATAPHTFKRLMNNDRQQIQVTSPHLVGRLNVEEVALLLHFQVHDIPVLVKAGMLKPLGKPMSLNTVKYFAATEVVALARDPVWLSKATKIINEYWADKNRRRTKN
jgi:hypothetical protein